MKIVHHSNVHMDALSRDADFMNRPSMKIETESLTPNSLKVKNSPYSINLSKLNCNIPGSEIVPNGTDLNDSYQVFTSKNRSIDEACN